ncbi:MAG TPA: MFS transporter [Candidatus Polarisedimenticolia bacterium]|nr:MFS transporter [Candidatus Polarisedimenticolia bacterium]
MNPWRGLRGLPRTVWILSATTLVNRLGTMALPFMALYLTRSRGFSGAEAGLVLTVYGLAALLAGPLSGRLCDRVGAVRVAQAALLLSGATVMALPFARTLGAILAITVLWALTNESFRPANLTLFSSFVEPERRKAAFALARLAVNLGMSVGPAAGGFLASVSFPVLFYVDGASSLAAGVVLVLSARYLAAGNPAPAGSGGGRDRSRGPSSGSDLGGPRAWTDRHLLYFLVALLPILVVFFQHEASMPLFLVGHLSMKESSYGLLFTLNTALIILLEVPLNLRTAHWTHRRTLALGAFLVGAGFGAMALCSGPLGVALTVVIWTFGEMMLLPGSSAYVADIAPPERRGSYMGLYTMSFSAAFTIGPGLGVAILERFGARVLWGAAFAFGCVSMAMLGRVGSRVGTAPVEAAPLVLPPTGEAL